ncbi:MAG TPA: biliverdin-producing heme oxygenase [Azospirillaceae bacterium]|nr:biliverdin-producing heme oxygenase [Azospirillaceae bacterium]
MDLVGYVRLLQTLNRFHSAVAPACRAGCVTIGAYDLLRPVDERLDRLRRDLAHLGVVAAPAPTDPVPDGPEGFAAGCLYTVQGSTLGGKVMHGWLQGLLPTAAGREFFQGGPEDGALWRGFCAKLEAYGADRGRLPAIVAGAHSAFTLFRSCLGSCP